MSLGLIILLGLVVFAIMLVVGTAIGAIFLKIAAKWAMKFKITYGKAFKTVLVSSLAGMLLGIIMGLGFYGAAYSQGGIEQVKAMMENTSLGLLFNLASGIMGFFMGGAVYGQMIKYPDTGSPIGFMKGIRISLFQILLVFLIALPLLLIGLVIGLVMAH